MKRQPYGKLRAADSAPYVPPIHVVNRVLPKIRVLGVVKGDQPQEVEKRNRHGQQYGNHQKGDCGNNKARTSNRYALGEALHLILLERLDRAQDYPNRSSNNDDDEAGHTYRREGVASPPASGLEGVFVALAHIGQCENIAQPHIWRLQLEAACNGAHDLRSPCCSIQEQIGPRCEH